MMSCPVCAHENLEGVRFCVKCGWQIAPLEAGGETTHLTAQPATNLLDTPHEETVQQLPAPTPLPTSALAHDDDGAGATTQEFTAQDFLVLVVDDTVDNLVIISLHLQQTGYRVVTATNGEEAVRVATLTQPDLILMDLSMPELDGLGATRKIRELQALRAVPVVAVTAFTTEGFQRAAYDAGLDGYLTKPLDFERMNDLIRSLLPVKRVGDLDTPGDA